MFGSDGPIRLQWFQLRVVIFLATGPWIQPRLMQRGNLHETVLHQLLGEAMKRAIYPQICAICAIYDFQPMSSHVMPFIPRLRLKKPILPVDISVHALSREEPEEEPMGAREAPHHGGPRFKPFRPRRLFQKSALDCTRLSNLDVPSLHPR